MSDKKWYKKQPLDGSSVINLGIEPLVYNTLSDTVHEGEFQAVADCLGIAKKYVINILYRLCDAPKGLVKDHIN